ncbi:NAD(P)/FAD-dependent oxidoreductase [Hymenobacter gummosus]|uniref:NAD(P)/FAD-dependent oxidoreductase n=1 Tax=Hymenobacter gummosus TaxID=1776032 RepID=A0A431UA42_9BACT|nr:FAD-dependent oxidoreductase [Hymenobacter gummosus]RTQ53732.1 NAD(P)/FAD-dependent oxidoreductase [Hymenobacter gummosus]
MNQDTKKQEKRVAVIGAGITGLSNAVHLLKSGYAVKVYEKQSAPGGVWNNLSNSGSYLQTNSLHYHFASGVRWKSKHPDRAEIRQQIAKVCASLPAGVVEFDTPVERVRFDADQVQVTVQGREETFDGIIVATGLHQAPFTPPEYRSFGGEVKHFVELDTIQDLDQKKVVVVGCGPSAMEALRSLSSSAKQIHLVCDKPRWIYPSIFLYNLLIFMPWSRPNQWLDRRIHKVLSKHYHKFGLQHMMPATSPVRTNPGSIWKEFFPNSKQSHVHLHSHAKISGFDGRRIMFADGRSISDVDVLVACTGWQPLEFPFFDPGLAEVVQFHVTKVGYLYLHEVVPGYPRMVLANYKSGIGSTGLAPFISSILLQNALEQASIYPSKIQQESWIAQEKLRWASAPLVFQTINVFESFVQTFLFFSHPRRIFWFLRKMSLRYIGKLPSRFNYRPETSV